ncbi:hypothetical protein [Shimia sagamensis]|uniref:Uncharacterized protein n=1 Tax=Shimia sagamensis TaxID=1566352 RepID=A0ABY1PEP2_9RHOB|nr:hypothetical protein [Shimia sagamensis]SMP32179.1 hypothetical protein SAMN06265373_108143 [Shimia sagamensis]
MSKDKPAAADPKPVPTVVTVKGVKLGRLPLESGKPGHPVAFFKGEVPPVDSTLKFTLENGVTYAGIVVEAVEADGEVMTEFKGGLTPLSKK